VEIAITLFPILQLARTKKDHKKRMYFFAMMITSLLSLFLDIPAPNDSRYPLGVGRASTTLTKPYSSEEKCLKTDAYPKSAARRDAIPMGAVLKGHC
jgi:hypothetical protein